MGNRITDGAMAMVAKMNALEAEVERLKAEMAAAREATIEECAKVVEAEADKMDWASRPSIMGRYLADKLRGQR